MSEQVEASFKNLLEELFQLDKPDLDFGIYRILNKGWIEPFLFMGELNRQNFITSF